jgi:hypothetical protein
LAIGKIDAPCAPAPASPRLATIKRDVSAVFVPENRRRTIFSRGGQVVVCALILSAVVLLAREASSN